MTPHSPVRIESAAANSLVEWKHLFANHVRDYAKQLALDSDQPELITLAHYQQAAKTALQKLTEAIENSEASDAQRRAA